jgi:hypothetical protein
VAYESYRRLEEALAHLVDTGSSLKLNKALAFWNERNTRPCCTIEWDETAFVHLRLLQHGLGKDEDISIALKEACDEAGFVVLLRFVECEVHGETWKSDEAICKQANIEIGRKEALEHGWDPPLGFEDSSWDKLVLFDPDVETEDFFKLSSKGTSHEQSLGNGASRAQSR